MDISTDSDIRLPVFIHSLFRAGSTYIFNVFRRSDADYWCYQEPLHEMAIIAKDNPNGLMINFGEYETTINRHPKLDKPYFQELFEAWPAWQDTIKEQFIFQSYFANDGSEIGIEFWQSLARVAKGRPVFQECRTSGRINGIKRHFDALHLYLWRNPWDQWWSYKINDYFEAANQLIIHANNPPAPLKFMLRELQLPRYIHNDIVGAIGYYQARSLTTEDSYLVFYMLWCFALREGSTYADLPINIDRLSDHSGYQKEVETKLRQLGIEELSFADCRVSQGVFSEKDKAFFHAAESRVHLWLLEGGWKQSDIEAIQKLREKFIPKVWVEPISNLKPDTLVDQIDRFSQLAKRFETANAEHQRTATKALDESFTKVQQLESAAQVALSRESQSQAQLTQALKAVHLAQTQLQEMLGVINQAESRAARAEEITNQQAKSLNNELEVLRVELQNVNQANHHHWQLADQRWQELQALYRSRSWRITAILRWPAQQMRLLRDHGLKNRTKAFIKKILRKINRYLLTRPLLRRWLLRLSQRFGLYQSLKKWRDQLQEHAIDLSQTKPLASTCNEHEKLSPQARVIYGKLKKLKAQQKGQR